MKQSALAEVWPLSPLQEGLLFHAEYDEHAMDIYVGGQILDLAGPLDAEVLRGSGQAMLDRHASLRASFQRRRSGAPVQTIARRVVLPWRGGGGLGARGVAGGTGGDCGADTGGGRGSRPAAHRPAAGAAHPASGADLRAGSACPKLRRDAEHGGTGGVGHGGGSAGEAL